VSVAFRHIQLTASGLMPPTAELRTIPPNTLRPSTCFRANQARSAVATTVLEDEAFQPAFLVQSGQLLIVQGATEDVGRGVYVSIHKSGDRADGLGRWREDAALRKYLALVKDRREPGGTGDRDASLEELASCRMAVRGVAFMLAAEVDRARRVWQAAAIGEFPSRQIGQTHGTAGLVLGGDDYL
jgi:hypothetical protein